MRSIRLAILPLLVAASLAAQAPTPPDSATRPAAAVVSPQRSAFLDLAALVDNRERFGLEPIVLGRWTLGLVGTHDRSSAQATPYGYPLPLAGGGSPGIPTTLCPVQGCPYPYPTSSDDAWSLDIGVRYYPAAMSFSDPRRRLMVYFGEFVGYQWRTVRNTSYVYPPVLANIPCPSPGCVPFPFTQTQRLTGWEPGAEVGARLRPLDPLFVDVGGWFKLVTVDDPTQRLRPGQLESRLVVAVGVGW